MKSDRAKELFRIRAARKVGREQKGQRSGVGVGKEGNAFPSFPTPTPLLRPFCSRSTVRAARMRKRSDFIRLVRERLLRRQRKSCMVFYFYACMWFSSYSYGTPLGDTSGRRSSAITWRVIARRHVIQFVANKK